MAVAKKTQTRPIFEIASEIRLDWKTAPQSALAYLKPMMQLTDVKETYGHDSAKSIILYFLSNATAWRGETARRIKKELNVMVK